MPKNKSSFAVDWEVMINGIPLKFSGMVMRRILINSTTGREASVCTIEFVSQSIIEKEKVSNDLVLKLQGDMSKFKVGMEFIVGVSKYGDKNKKIVRAFSGFLESIDLKIDDKGLTTVVLHGMDAKMWMMSTNYTVSFDEKKKYAGVVTEIFSKYRLADAKAMPTVKIDGNSGLSENIYCYGMSEYDFLCKIADLTSSMFFVNEYGGLNFIHYSKNASSKKILKYSDKVFDLRFLVSVWGIPKAVEVFSLDEKDFTKRIVGKADNRSGPVGTGRTASAMISRNIKGEIKIYDSSAGSKKNAEARAQAEYDRRVYNLVRVRITVPGSPDYNLSKGLTLKNFDEPLNGDYVISEIIHDYDFDSETFLTTMCLNSAKYNM